MQVDAIDHRYAFDRGRRDAFHRDVFVIETHGLPLLAFEADNRQHAEDLVRSRKLTQAIDRFCAAKCASSLAHYTLRIATDSEASLYEDVATEFAEHIPRLLVAYLPGLAV